MSVAVAIGGSLGGLTAAIKLKETYDTVYCLLGFNNYEKSSNHGESRGLRTVNLKDELLDIIIEGWSYWEQIGISGDILRDCIIHKFKTPIQYEFCDKHKKLLEILDSICPLNRPRESKQLNDTTLFEDTGIYAIQDIVHQLKCIAQKNGVILSKVHVKEIIYSKDCVYLYVEDSKNGFYELDCDYCIISIGNEFVNIKTNLNFVKPVSVWNEFSYYIVPEINFHDGIWTWGTRNYNTGEVYNDRLGFYVMMESPELLKVACDTSFIKNTFDISKKNLKDYRSHKNNFVTHHLNLKYTNVYFQECYYSVAPFVQHCGPVTIINSGGYGYCTPGFVLRAINKLRVPENEHYSMQLFASKRHDLSTF